MRCLYCGSALRESKTSACSSCRGALSASMRKRLEEYEAKHGDSGGVVKALASLLRDHAKYVVVAVLLVLFIASQLFRFPYKAPEAIAAGFTTRGDPCFRKKRCLVIYSAPWCPACRSDVPFVNELNRYFAGSPNVGVKVYIGSDDAERLRAFASEYHAMTVLDFDQRIKQALSVRSFPSYYWVTDEGKVTKSPRGSYMLLPGKSQVESYVQHFFGDEVGIL